MNTLCFSLDPKVSREKEKGNICLMRIYNRVDIIYKYVLPQISQKWRNVFTYVHIKIMFKILFKTKVT